MSFLELYQATNQARDRIYTASENWMKGSPYAGGDLYDWARGTAYTGMDIAAGWWMPFGKIKAAGAALKTASAAIKAEKTAHASTTLLKTNAVSARLFKSNAQKTACTVTGFSGRKGFELSNAFYQPVRNQITIINGRVYSAHGLDQMQNRGIVPSVVEEAIKFGKMQKNKVLGRLQYYDPKNNITVVTENEKLVTVMYGRVK